jgi:hypothetical protein
VVLLSEAAVYTLSCPARLPEATFEGLVSLSQEVSRNQPLTMVFSFQRFDKHLSLTTICFSKVLVLVTFWAPGVRAGEFSAVEKQLLP